MGAVLEDELLSGTAFIHEEEGDAAVRILECQISDAGRYVSACLDSHRAGFHHLGGISCWAISPRRHLLKGPGVPSRNQISFSNPGSPSMKLFPAAHARGRLKNLHFVHKTCPFCG